MSSDCVFMSQAPARTAKRRGPIAVLLSSRKAQCIAAVAVLFAGYVNAYVLMVHPIPVPGAIIDDYHFGRFGPVDSRNWSTFFWPLNAVDRRLRPHLWESRQPPGFLVEPEVFSN